MDDQSPWCFEVAECDNLTVCKKSGQRQSAGHPGELATEGLASGQMGKCGIVWES